MQSSIQTSRQTFDALSLLAILHEAKSMLVNRKVDKVVQLGRDEIVLVLRSRGGISHLLLSAHATFGRLCLVNLTAASQLINPRKNLGGNLRNIHNNPPAFCMLLRKHLVGATIVGVEQVVGERIVDLVFSCTNELGSPSFKVLTAEIMGRHSNLIFWEKENDKILGASHVVTKEMSRHREIFTGLRYIRPPHQDKPNLFKLKREEFDRELSILKGQVITRAIVEQWLLNTLTGLGRHLAAEIVLSCGEAFAAREENVYESVASVLWRKIEFLQSISMFKPAMDCDLARYTVLSWFADQDDLSKWKTFPSVNDMVDEYYRLQELKEKFQQMKDRLLSELRSEQEKVKVRLETAARNMEGGTDLERHKLSGDLILTHLNDIELGQTELTCEDLHTGQTVKIELQPNLSASQNAQLYYRQFAKARIRLTAASAAQTDAYAQQEMINQRLNAVETAQTMEALERVRETLLGRIQKEAIQAVRGQAARGQKSSSSKVANNKIVAKSRLLNIISSDGWTIVVGRNRYENDELISRIAQPQDIWMHVLGQGGAHVLIRVPASKQEPPATTLNEAAQAAARLSKAVAGGKIRVVYTQCKYVKKIPGNKPGLVRYENEKTIEVDTATPMPKALNQLFKQR